MNNTYKNFIFCASLWLKKYVLLVFMLPVIGTTYGEIIHFEGIGSSTVTTGNLLDEADHLGITVNVVEISGLQLTARSGGIDQKINVTNTSLGINAVGVDDTDAFEVGEKVIISFNKDIQINLLDFNLFDAGESFTIAVSNQAPVVIGFDDLSNKTSDLFESNFLIPANTDIELFTTGTDVIGLDAMDIEVVPEPAVISFIAFAGVAMIVLRRVFGRD